MDSSGVKKGSGSNEEHTLRFSALSKPAFLSTVMMLVVPGTLYSFMFSEIWSPDTQRVYTACAISVFSAFYLPKYYQENIVETVKITCKKNSQNAAIMKVVENSISEFRPTFWALSGHVQSFMFAYWPLSVVFKFGKKSSLVFERQTLTMSDGGVVQLDWAQQSETQNDMGECSGDIGSKTGLSNATEEAKPILIILPGVVGKSANAYVHRIGLVSQKAGYRVVVKGYRGIDAPMKSFLPETWGPRSLEDLHETLQVVHQRFPSAHIVGVGFSFGGLCLQSYLGSPLGHKYNMLKAAASLSGCFDPRYIYEFGVLPHRIIPYDTALAFSVNKDLQKNLDVINTHLGVDVRAMLKYSRTMQDYHKTVTVPAMGLETVDDYWKMMGSFHKRYMKSIKTPVLSILAEDDPLIPSQVASGAIEAITQSEGVILLQTKRGGHAGFFEGATGECYADRVALEFLGAALSRW
eukprot:CFRG1839T1